MIFKQKLEYQMIKNLKDIIIIKNVNHNLIYSIFTETDFGATIPIFIIYCTTWPGSSAKSYLASISGLNFTSLNGTNCTTSLKAF